MPDEQFRPEVVARLSEPAHLPATLVDEILDASPAEREAAAAALLDSMGSTRAALEEAGYLPHTRSVLDLTLREAQSIVAGLGRLLEWWPQPALAQHRAGDVVKVVPPDVAAFAVALLRWGGWLPPTAEPEE